MLTNNSSLIENIKAMKKQENSSYLTKNGLYDHNYTRQEETTIMINRECRKLMIAWFKQLGQFCEMNHNTIAMAVNTLDRFIEKERHIISNDNASHDFQLAGLACFYTTVKTQELVALDLDTMSKLCQDSISTQEIKEMELKILTKLGWRVNAPTAISFADIYLKILFPSSQQSNRSRFRTLIQCQLEYAMEDAHFLGISASEIAFTATYNAITVIATAASPYYSRLAALQKSIIVPFLPHKLRSNLMDHMRHSESDIIYSLRKDFSSSAIYTENQQEQQQQEKFEWLSDNNSVCSYHSPRSIVMSRE